MMRGLLSFGIGSCALALLTTSAIADDLPVRKPGLWEMKIVKVGSQLRSTFTASAIAAASTRVRAGTSGSAAMPSASFQAVSAGRISAATFPGGVIAAAIASAPSFATERASGEVRTQPQNGRAAVSMSDVSGAS